ncbi:hypothetical protein TIFTF001_007161 [Ficus carica]|uniref:Uncharacterized protein n=1 Tax=Ficus carica TaxID=3494 RepID=A0AA88A5V8_FICCA|nr:hypothetical protein TIFTF001_007161 [Ficus carica]
MKISNQPKGEIFEKEKGHLPGARTWAVVLGVRVPDVGVSHDSLLRQRGKGDDFRAERESSSSRR